MEHNYTQQFLNQRPAERVFKPTFNQISARLFCDIHNYASNSNYRTYGEIDKGELCNI